ncbi:MAG: molybdopterin-dependent oxidoreductase, partial [Pseudomonadota bacterium]
MLQNPGAEYTRNGATHTYPDVQMIFNAGNNFASHQQDTNELLRALQKVHTVVCVDPWWTASARFADIVLPATTTLERNEISSGGTYSKDKVYAMKQVIEPLGESLDDWEIFRRLAEMFGVEQQYTDGWEVMDLVEASYSKSTAAEVMDFEEFWERGVVRIPVPRKERDWVRHGDFRE